MSSIEDSLVSNLAAWLDANRPSGLQSGVAIYVANRDELRVRPCVVFDASDAKRVSGLPNSARMKLDVILFSQIDDTTSSDHATNLIAVQAALRDKTAIKSALNSDTFILHDLIIRESGTTIDGDRGRESTVTYEAIVSAS